MNRSPGLSWTRHLLWPAGVVVIGASVLMESQNPFTTVAGAGPWSRWTAAAAAAALIAAAVGAAAGGRRAVAAGLAATGLLWLVPEWLGWAAGPAELRILAGASGAFVLVAALLAVSAWSGGRRRGVVLVTATAGATVVAVAQVALLDPFLDPVCWRFCGHNPLLLASAPGAGRAVVWIGTVVMVGSAAVACLFPLRRRADPVSVLIALGSVTLLAGLSIAMLMRLVVVEASATNETWLPAMAAAVGAIAVAVGTSVERADELRVRWQLTRLVDELRATGPEGALQVAMASALGDPELRLLFWSASRGEYVDAAGRRAAVPAAPGRMATTIVRRGQRVAVVVHATTIDGARMQRAIGPAVRLSLENDQLRAATLAELAELRSSRTRIIERSDDERRRLERNLHDGAQQRIVGVALLVRRIRARTADDWPCAASALRAAELIATILDELRRVARGIYPTVLTDGGLHSAVHDLAESSTDLAVQISSLPAGRYPPGVEAAAYLVVAESVADARRRRATNLTVSAIDRDGILVVDVVDDAPGRAGPRVVELDDRVGALGGRLTISPDGPATRVHLELPCGS